MVLKSSRSSSSTATGASTGSWRSSACTVTAAEQRPVREARRQVVERLVREPVLELHPLGHVADVDDVALHRLVAHQIGDQRLRVHGRAVLPGELQRRERRRAVCEARCRDHRAGERRDAAGHHQLGEPHPDHRLLRAPEHALDRRARVADRGVLGDDEDELAGVAHERARGAPRSRRGADPRSALRSRVPARSGGRARRAGCAPAPRARGRRSRRGRATPRVPRAAAGCHPRPRPALPRAGAAASRRRSRRGSAPRVSGCPYRRPARAPRRSARTA